MFIDFYANKLDLSEWANLLVTLSNDKSSTQK